MAFFYWFQWRPSQIRKGCSREAAGRVKEMRSGREAIETYEIIYKTCLREKGLK